MKKFGSDIDLDFGDRDKALSVLRHIPAGIIRNNVLTRHNTGVYVTSAPTDLYSGACSLDYKQAEQRGYVKIDFLNVSVYSQIKDDAHLTALLTKEPDWARLYDEEFCNKLIHINGHYTTLLQFPEPVDSIPRLAMFIAAIRPAKRHLIGNTWQEVAKTIWEKPTDGSYGFKMAHSISYAHLIVVHLNLLCEQ